MSGTAYLYINPNAPAEARDFYEKNFSDVTTRVSAMFIPELTGGFADDEGPAISEYAAVVIDEDGSVNVFEPVIPAEVTT